MPDPNEVMDVEDQPTKPYLEEIDYGRFYSDDAIQKIVAQQNTALLRELLKNKSAFYAPPEDWPQYLVPETRIGLIPMVAIPASILEAKLNELDTTKEVEI